MLWIYLIILFLLFSGGLMFFLWYVLRRNYNKATGDLQALSRDVISKEEEAKRILQNAQKEAKSLVAKETQTASETREKLIKEAHEQKDQIIQEANQKANEITEKAQRNADFLKKEIDQKIDESAREKVFELINNSIPKEFLEDVQQRWIEESEKTVFNFKNIKLPDEVKEARIVSAFPLTDKQKEFLTARLKKRIGQGAKITTDVDANLVAGFIIKVGSIEVDASLKNKMLKEMMQ